MRNWKAVLSTLITAFPALVWASAQPSAQQVVLSPPVHDFSKGFNLAMIQPIHSLRSLRSSDIGMVIPAKDLRPTSDGSSVAAQIMDHSLSNFLNSPLIRNSELGQTARSVEKSLESQIEIGQDSEESVKHSLKFAMSAFQTRALIHYKGLTNASLTYQIVHSTLGLEVREPLPKIKTDLVYNHVTTQDDKRDMISLRWKW